MRTETCLTCDQTFTPTPRHPMVESAWCHRCYRVIAPMWNMAYVAPAEIGRAIRAEDV